jgi:hypothetical protein
MANLGETKGKKLKLKILFTLPILEVSPHLPPTLGHSFSLAFYFNLC